jgi:hypothetical protein
MSENKPKDKKFVGNYYFNNRWNNRLPETAEECAQFAWSERGCKFEYEQIYAMIRKQVVEQYIATGVMP